MTDLAWLTARPIAHRGYHDMNRNRWENTLSAFEAAARRGFAIECDVHLSSDGVPVIFHDGDLQRLTGTPGLIWQRTAGEMAALRVGGTADHVPTLKEVLDLVDGRVPLIIEMKGIPGRDEGLVGKVARMLDRYEGNAAIMSFDHWLIRRCPVEAPGIPVGLTAWGARPQEWEAHFSMLGYGISFVSYSYTELPNPFATFVRERLAMPLITWTIRDREGIEKTLAEGDQMTFEGFDPDAGIA